MEGGKERGFDNCGDAGSVVPSVCVGGVLRVITKVRGMGGTGVGCIAAVVEGAEPSFLKARDVSRCKDTGNFFGRNMTVMGILAGGRDVESGERWECQGRWYVPLGRSTHCGERSPVGGARWKNWSIWACSEGGIVGCARLE